MATLQKTYRGDLSGAIAGVLWSRIKEANTKKELEKSNASDDIKEAAVELGKEDPSDKSIPVQDKNLRDSVTRIFGKLEGRLFSLQGKANNISGKVTTLAGGIADTQDLIINQNQLLEDKFDIILKNIGAISSIDKKNEAESELDRVEAELEKGFDLSGTFAYEKTNTGSFGVFGKILSGILGNRFTTALISQISKSLIPKTVRLRTQALKTVGANTIKRFARKLVKPGSSIAKRALSPFALYGSKKLFGALGKAALGRLGKDYFFERGLTSLFRNVGRKNITLKKIGAKLTINQLADLIIEAKTIDANAKRKMVKIAAKSAARNKKGIIKTGGKVIQKNIPGLTQAAGRKIVKKTSQQVGSKALNKALSAGDGRLLRALNSPLVQRKIVEKIGKEGAEKIGIKLAQGGVKGGFPLFGTAYGVVEGLVRLALGDPAGMMLSFGSSIPIAGWGFAIIDILRDIDKNAYIEHIKPNLPVPANENLAGYFQQAFGLTPDQYERGNIDIKSSMIGDNTSAISEILGVTQAFGDATGFGGEAARIISDFGLGSYSVPKVNYGFDIGGFSTSKNIESIQGSEEEKELRMVRKKKKEDDDDDEKKKEEEKKEEKVDPTGGDPTDFRNIGKNIKNWWNNMRGGGGIGGDDNVQATTPIMGGNGATIEFWGEQGKDLSGEPGVDFSYKDYKSNYSLFPGYVLETGLLYGSRYGNVVVVRSVDPSNGLEFDSLYAHFPNGGIAVKPGQVVSAGEYLGAVGFIGKRGPNGEARMQGNGAGNMSGYHTSVDFYEPGSYDKYRNLSVIQSLVTGAEGQTPVGLLEKLKPPTKSNDQSSLNNVESNNRLATTMTNMVENGSSERLMTKRKASKRPPIVIINNQIVNTSQTQIAMGNNNKESGNFFEAYNLARYTV